MSQARRFVSLKWKTLALVCLALAAVHGFLVLQNYRAQLRDFQGRQSRVFEHRTEVFTQLLEQSGRRLEHFGVIVPALAALFQDDSALKERWSAMQLELGLEAMQLYDAQGRLRFRGLPTWGDAPPDALAARVRAALSAERPMEFIACRPECLQYALAPSLDAHGGRQVMLLAASLADAVLQFPGLTGADLAILAEMTPGADPSRALWERFNPAAVSNAPVNAPKLRSLAEAATLDQVERGYGLRYAGRDYRFHARPLAAYGSVTPGEVLIFADTTDSLADIRRQIVSQLAAGAAALLAALLLLFGILNAPMNRLRKLARALPLLASRDYEPARRLIGSGFDRRRTRTEIEVLEGVAADLSRQLEELEHTLAARNATLAEKVTELKRANALTEKILATAPVIVLVQSAGGGIVRMNEFGCGLLGYTEAEVRATPFMALLADAHSRDQATAALADLAANRRSRFEQIAAARCVDGSRERITWLHTRLDEHGETYVLTLGLPARALEETLPQTLGGFMRAIYIRKPGACDVLELREAPAPRPGPGELAIAVRAAGVNFADILARQGIYPDAPPYPCVVGYEAAGTVSAVGADVDRAWLGREVMALTNFGGYAETITVGEDYVWQKPQSLTFEQAAAIPLNYLTAWALTAAMGGLAAGETVLIHNAGGGVGLAALDIVRHLGARVIGAASARKHPFLRSRGCEVCIDYRRDDWPQRVLEATGGKGVELALDPIGGAHWRQSYSVLRATGRLGMFGISAAATGGFGAKLNLLKLVLSAPWFHPLRLVPGNRGAFGVNIHAMYREAGKFRAWMDGILRGVAEGWVRPQVDRVFRFDEAAAAHEYIEARANIGKVLLAP